MASHKFKVGQWVLMDYPMPDMEAALKRSVGVIIRLGNSATQHGPAYTVKTNKAQGTVYEKEIAPINSGFLAHLAGKYPLKKGGFMSNWNTEISTAPEIRLKKFRIQTSETEYRTYEVEAESEEEAKEMVREGEVENYDSDWDNWNLDLCEEIIREN